MKFIFTILAFAFPVFAFAQAVTIPVFLNRLKGILEGIIPFIVGLAVFVILWGIFTYISQAANEEKRAEARLYIIYGILGVFFMLSIWGFVNILVNTFVLDKEIKPDQIPRVPPLSTGS